MTRWLTFALAVLAGIPLSGADSLLPPDRVLVVSVRNSISEPTVYLVRRAVKQAMAENVSAIVLDLNARGGNEKACLEIMQILAQYHGMTATYVTGEAFSMAAFTAFAAKRIYMAPNSMIGVASGKNGEGSAAIKISQNLRASLYSHAAGNGHNKHAVEAMLDPEIELAISGETIKPKGRALILTDTQAKLDFGAPPQPLISAGTVDSLPELLVRLGFPDAKVIRVEMTGAERAATLLNAIDLILLALGLVCLFLEFKIPGFGVFGVTGIMAMFLYFFGSHIAGFSGAGWGALFALGMALLALEIFVLPGNLVFGFAGAGLMLLSIVMALVDHYPGATFVPTWAQMEPALTKCSVALLIAVAAILWIGKRIPNSTLIQQFTGGTTSGSQTVLERQRAQSSQIGLIGKSQSPLLPGGKAMFGNQLLDVITRGEAIETGRVVRIIAYSGDVAVVEGEPGFQG